MQEVDFKEGSPMRQAQEEGITNHRWNQSLLPRKTAGI